jgi:HSP20 family molecular chaperone IbpA
MAEEITPSQDGRSRITEVTHYRLLFPMPGFTRDNILVAFVDGCVEIHGRSRSEWQEKAPGLEYCETEEVVAHHHVPLPPDADLDKARVTLIDGEVLIQIPRKSQF